MKLSPETQARLRQFCMMWFSHTEKENQLFDRLYGDAPLSETREKNILDRIKEIKANKDGMRTALFALYNAEIINDANDFICILIRVPTETGDAIKIKITKAETFVF